MSRAGAPGYQATLILSFIDYEQAHDSVDRKSLFISYGITDKYIKVIDACTRLTLLRLR